MHAIEGKVQKAERAREDIRVLTFAAAAFAMTAGTLLHNIGSNSRIDAEEKTRAAKVQDLKKVRRNVGLLPASGPMYVTASTYAPNGVSNAAMTIYSNLLADLRYDALQPSPFLNAGYVQNVMDQASWVSEKLQIPKVFVMADWFMEIGKGSTLSNLNIQYNNLCNAGMQTSNGFDLMRFPSLMAFSIKYVGILSAAHVPPTSNAYIIVSDMQKSGFFGNESVQSYLANVEGVVPIVTPRPYNPSTA